MDGIFSPKMQHSSLEIKTSNFFLAHDAAVTGSLEDMRTDGQARPVMCLLVWLHNEPVMTAEYTVLRFIYC